KRPGAPEPDAAKTEPPEVRAPGAKPSKRDSRAPGAEDEDQTAPPRIADVGLGDRTTPIFDRTTRRVPRGAIADLIAETRDEDDVGPTRAVRPLRAREAAGDPAVPSSSPTSSALSSSPSPSPSSSPFGRELAMKRLATVDAPAEAF